MSAPDTRSSISLAEKAFLGPEFVTWLYFHLEAEGWELHLPDAFPDRDSAPADDLVQFALGKRTTLRRLDETGARVVLSGTEIDGGGELFQAVRRGALIDSISLEMSVDSRVYGFTLSGSDGGLSGVKFPDMFTDPEADDGALQDPLAPSPAAPRAPKLPLEDVIELRVICMEDIENVLDTLFERFLVRRLAAAWESEDRRLMQQVVAKELKVRTPAP